MMPQTLRALSLALLSSFALAEPNPTLADPETGKEPADDRPTVWGINGDTGWIPMLPEKELDGLEKQGTWTRDKDTLTSAAGEEGSSLYFGGNDWKSYELDFHVTPISGGNAQVKFRISADGKKFYMLDFLLGWQAVGISKVDNGPGGKGLQKISVVNLPLQRNKEYHVQVAVRDASITTYVDGKLVNQVTDYDNTQGRIGFIVWNGKTSFRNPRYRRLS